MPRVHTYIKNLQLVQYMADSRVYVVSVTTEGSVNSPSQFAYIPEYIFYHIRQTCKQEEIQENCQMENEHDLQKTLLNAGGPYYNKNLIKQAIEERNQHEQTVLFKSNAESKQKNNKGSSLQKDNVKPMLDYDSFLQDPNFRKAWKNRNERLLKSKLNHKESNKRLKNTK